MLLLRTAHQTRRPQARAAGFSLAELTMALGLVGVMSLITVGVLRSGYILSSQNVNLNVSGKNARQMIDRIGEAARYAYWQPTLVTPAGVDVTGATATADGLMVERYLGWPYILKESGGTTGDISATAKTFVLECRTEASGPTMPAPRQGDYLHVESITQPELEIATVSAATVQNVNVTTGSTTATVSITKRTITTVNATGELIKPSMFRVGCILFRKEAYTFASAENGRFDLRYYPKVTMGMNWAGVDNYVVLSNGFRRVGTTPFFANVQGTYNNKYTQLTAQVNSTTRSEYVARGNTTSAYTTLPAQVKLWSINE